MADKRVYHVVKRSEDNKWEVKANGDSRPLKLFDTKDEALDYAKEVAKNQEGTVLVHNTKGEKAGKIAESYDYGKKKTTTKSTTTKSTTTTTAKEEPKEEAKPKTKKELKAEAKAKKKAEKEQKKAAKKAAKKK